jgi:hypothetical protein
VKKESIKILISMFYTVFMMNTNPPAQDSRWTPILWPKTHDEHQSSGPRLTMNTNPLAQDSRWTPILWPKTHDEHQSSEEINKTLIIETKSMFHIASIC